MKKLSFILLVTFAFFVIAFKPVNQSVKPLVYTIDSLPKERVFHINFTETKVNKHWQKLTTIQNLIDQSNLPHDVVKFVFLSLDSLKMDIAADVQRQLADTTKKK
jgi:hypothetical protein